MASPRSRLERAFEHAVADLEGLGARFAVVGGLAVSALVEPRTTRDIDFLVSADDEAAAEALIFGLRLRGYEIEAVLQRTDGTLSTVRAASRRYPTVLVDLLFDATRLEAEVVAQARVIEVFPGVPARVVSLVHLAAMKVKAGRPKDQADLEALVRPRSGPELREVEAALRLMQRRGVAPGRDLVKELRALVKRLR